jgi:hypothetical protein
MSLWSAANDCSRDSHLRITESQRIEIAAMRDVHWKLRAIDVRS